MSTRLDISEVTSFVNVLTDADATGASIGDILKEQSEQMRLERFVRAEKAGAKASQYIMSFDDGIHRAGGFYHGFCTCWFAISLRRKLIHGSTVQPVKRPQTS